MRIIPHSGELSATFRPPYSEIVFCYATLSDLAPSRLCSSHSCVPSSVFLQNVARICLPESALSAFDPLVQLQPYIWCDGAATPIDIGVARGSLVSRCAHYFGVPRVDLRSTGRNPPGIACFSRRFPPSLASCWRCWHVSCDNIEVNERG